MNTIIKSELFENWLSSLKDMRAKFAVIARLRRAELGNFGDHKALENGISEMRIDVGPGYRIYYMREDDCVYVLLVGGNKSSQQRDIARAKIMVAERRRAL